MNICFLDAAAEEIGAVAAVLAPTEAGVEETASTETLVGEIALMTVL